MYSSKDLNKILECSLESQKLCIKKLNLLIEEDNIQIHFKFGFHNYNDLEEWDNTLTKEQKEKLSKVLDDIKNFLIKNCSLNNTKQMLLFLWL